jgi:outer membrane receptor protein involved in Fe transport
LVVTADRAPEPASDEASSVTVLDSAALADSPAVSLDDALLSDPDFSLFRRDGSLTANPTTQGVSLRGLGPSGASRSLVLLDGIPLNDPFGGWITWSQVPRDSLARAEVVAGGGATAWGNAAMGGVVQLLTDPLAGSRIRLTASIGDFDTRESEIEVTEPAGSGTVQILGSAFATDGYRIVSPETAGPIDIPASSQHSWATARWRQPLGPDLEAVLTVHTFEEARNNGTPYEANWTRENLASLTLDGSPGGSFAWSGSAYSQNGDFASTYSSVNAARTAETPAEDQYAVPSTAVGSSWTGTWKNAGGATTNVGADIRDVRGETREDYSYTNGTYADGRLAGGRQDFAGLFALREQPIGPDVTASAGARLDDWKESDGHLRQYVLSTDTPIGDQEYPDRSGTGFSPSAGITWRVSGAWRLRADAERGFRVPTLNELYRPFRQGSSITEANPGLEPEHVTSSEVGADGDFGRFQAGAAAFGSLLRDAVDAVTIATGPATVPGIGAIPAGGTGLERLNLGEVRVGGIRSYAQWRASDSLKVRVDLLAENTDILDAAVNPALVGNRLVQVPDVSAVFGAVWSAPLGFEVAPRIRWIGDQFSDDQNLLRQPAVVVADLMVSHPLGRHARLFVTVENLGGAQIVTDVASNGVVNVGEPRLALFGIRFDR